MNDQQSVAGDPVAGSPVKISQTRLISLLRRCDQYQEWKKSVFIRDRFTCQHCGARNGRKRVIEADHIISFAELMKQHQIKSVDEALLCPALWNITNGRTLCHSCHEKTESYPRNFITKPKKEAPSIKRHEKKKISV